MPPPPLRPPHGYAKGISKRTNAIQQRMLSRAAAERAALLVDPGPLATVLAIQLFQLALRGNFNTRAFREMNQRYKKR